MDGGGGRSAVLLTEFIHFSRIMHVFYFKTTTSNTHNVYIVHVHVRSHSTLLCKCNTRLNQESFSQESTYLSLGPYVAEAVEESFIDLLGDMSCYKALHLCAVGSSCICEEHKSTSRLNAR